MGFARRGSNPLGVALCVMIHFIFDFETSIWREDNDECGDDGRSQAHKYNVRMPGVEPGSQAWEACMMPLHYMRCAIAALKGIPQGRARRSNR